MRFLAYILFSLFFLNCKSQQVASADLKPAKNVVKQENFEKAINQILKAYNDKNQVALSKFINPQIGLYFLYRPGTVDYWQNVKEICFDSKCLTALNIPEWGKEALKNQKLNLSYKLEKTNQEIVGCESVLKNGLFAEDNKETNYLLSETITKYISAFKSDLEPEKATELNKKSQEIKNWESKSKRIILAQNKNGKSNGEAFVFYLTEINSKWYLSIIDYISFDCSV